MTVPNQSRFRRYVIVIARWLVVTASVFTITFFAGIYATNNFLTKYYSATAQIEIRSSIPSDGGITPAELETILSADVLLPVIKDLSLDTEWSHRIFNSQAPSLTELETVGQMDKMLRLVTPRGTNIVNITVVDDVPKEAADIANAIADRYKTLRDSEVEQETSVPGSHDTPTESAQGQTSSSLRIGATPPASSTTFPAAMTDATSAPETSPAVLHESPVRIVSRAEVPTAPSRPNRSFCFYITLIAATLLSLVAASFVEVIFLFLRAAEAAGSLSEVKPRSTTA